MNNLKINNIIILFFVLTINGVFSQNKKEQIEILTDRVDSLIVLLNQSNDSNSAKLILLDTKQSFIDSLKRNNIELEKYNVELQQKLASTNNKLYQSNKLNIILKNYNDSLSEAIKINFNYLDIIENGYSLTDENGMQGSKCEHDIDGDGKKDLVIILFNGENEGMVTIYLSSSFIKNKSYQTFQWLWNGNSLTDFTCGKQELHLSGGIENQGLYSEITLIYNPLLGKMIVKSYEDSSGKTTFNELLTKYIK